MTNSDNDGITLRTILEHMRGMENRLQAQISSVKTELAALNAKVDHNHAMLTLQLDNIDKRLDDIEVVQVPKLKNAIKIS